MGVAGVAIFLAGISVGAYAIKFNQAALEQRETVGLDAVLTSKSAGEKAFESGDYRTAMKHLFPLAKKGDARAQLLVGEIYYHDRKQPQDDVAAMKWFRLSAKQDNANAQSHLGEMYAQGHAVPQDHTESARWYRLAAEQGYARAQYNLGLAYAKGKGVPQDNMLAHMWFNLAVARFHASDSLNRSMAMKNRDVIASKMTSDLLAEAQRLASDWKPR
jgi:TPR repeat protein